MKKMSQSFIPGVVLALVCVAPLVAQAPLGAPTDPTATAGDAPTSGQAPDAVMKRLSELVHEGKYAEAQQLTAGLLVAFPDDQRLIKAKALLDKSLANAAATNTTPGSNPAVTNETSTQPVTSTKGGQLTGMERVDYNALIELARQAQQATDLSQQKTLLQQFMDQSALFSRKHPDQMLLWQLRAASALSLSDPDAGYEAGQTLLAAGAADSNDPTLQQLISKLKIKGWLDRQGVEQSKQQIDEDKKYGWLLGKWRLTFTYFSKAAFDYGEKHGTNDVEFVKSGSSVEGHVIINGRTYEKPAYKYTVRNSGEVTLATNWEVSPKPPQWEPITSISFGSDMKTMTIVHKGYPRVFTKTNDPQNQ
jgi:hypothetical protein